MPGNLSKIQWRVDYISQHAATAMNRGREWDTIQDIVHTSKKYLKMAESRPYTEAELEKFLELIEPGYQYVRRTVAGKRRPHPERSKRHFL